MASRVSDYLAVRRGNKVFHCQRRAKVKLLSRKQLRKPSGKSKRLKQEQSFSACSPPSKWTSCEFCVCFLLQYFIRFVVKTEKGKTPIDSDAQPFSLFHGTTWLIFCLFLQYFCRKIVKRGLENRYIVIWSLNIQNMH